jgi:dTDP-4-dehydrorhamnose 3,5-epimerase-like enzyme
MNPGSERLSFVPMDPHSDPRGWVLNPFEGLPPGSSVSNCHVFSAGPGARRGNHVHSDREERVVVLSGSLVARDLDTGEEIELSPERPGMLRIAPAVPHLFENRGLTTAVAICFSAVAPPAPGGEEDRGGPPSGSVSLR